MCGMLGKQWRSSQCCRDVSSDLEAMRTFDGDYAGVIDRSSLKSIFHLTGSNNAIVDFRVLSEQPCIDLNALALSSSIVKDRFFIQTLMK